MNTFEYDVYYQWDGRSKSDPFATEKSQDQIEHALRSFHGDLRHRLNDLNATAAISPVVTGTKQARLTVTTVQNHAEVNAALTVTLSDWGLYADPIEAQR